MTPAAKAPGPCARAALLESNKEDASSMQKEFFLLLVRIKAQPRDERQRLGWILEGLIVRLEELLQLGGTSTNRLYQSVLQPPLGGFTLTHPSATSLPLSRCAPVTGKMCLRREDIGTAVDIIWTPTLSARSAVSNIFCSRVVDTGRGKLSLGSLQKYYRLKTTYQHVMKDRLELQPQHGWLVGMVVSRNPDQCQVLVLF